jgi:hypothetical protein
MRERGDRDVARDHADVVNHESRDDAGNGPKRVVLSLS